jgi:hypothetical protein
MWVLDWIVLGVSGPWRVTGLIVGVVETGDADISVYGFIPAGADEQMSFRAKA